MSFELTLFTILFVKHFVVDFPLQGPFQYLNKGTYGHVGGIFHSTLHGVTTFVCLALLTIFTDWYIVPTAAATVAVVEGVAHYHIDWAKVNINKRMGWGPTTHEQFWWLLGADQLLHALTYIAMVWFLV